MVLTITTPLTVGFSLLQILLPRYLIIIITGTCAGIAMTFFQVAAAPFLMRYSGPQERPYLFSLNFALSLLAGILGSLVGGILPEIIRRTGVNLIPAYQITLIIFGGLVLVAVIPYLSIEEKQNLTNNHELKIEQDTNWSIIIKLFLPTFLVGLGAGLSIPFINLYFRDRFHLHSGVIGTYFAINQGLMITGLLLSPPLAQRFGKISVVIGSQLLSIPFLIAMGLTYYLPLAVVSFLFRATLMNMAQPLVTNFAMEAVREKEQALTNALLVMAWSTGRGISANIGGILIERYSYGLPFFVTSLLYLISTILYIQFFWRMERISKK